MKRFGAAVLVIFAFSTMSVRAAVASTIGAINVPSVAHPPSLDPTEPDEAWKSAAHVALAWDVTHQRAASEPSYAFIESSGSDLYVRFDVTQRETLLAQQHANNVGDGTDDEVWIDLWPDGPGGFFYQFAATSNGTHYQYSSENTAYSPTWESRGRASAHGFTVTMQIPLDIIRGAHAGGSWRVQFVRVIRSTGERQIWSYAPQQTNGDDVAYAGLARGLRTIAVARPQPRVGIYALGAAGSRGSGLDTSRVGADFSIPVTQTSSVYGTIHPDFSNVEIDQATISPSAFARFYTETRPFFTQGANYYDSFDCDACPAISQLYTPSIPTPREGYALEGHQGQTRFGAFDAIGLNRTDAAQSFHYLSRDTHYNFTVQRVAADSPSYHDDVDTTGLAFKDNKHVSAYVDYGSDRGSNVAVGNMAQRYDAGTWLYTNTSGIALAERKVGYYYNPVDGYVEHPDIAGYAVAGAKLWLFGSHSAINSVGVSGFLDRYHNFTGALDQTDNQLLVDLLTKSRWDLQLTSGSAYVLENNCASSPGNLIPVNPLNYATYVECQVFTPASQNGISVTYHSGTANSPGNFLNHGASSTPTTISFNTGAFGPGRVDSWARSTTMRLGMRGTIAFEADDTRQYLFTGATNVQWLERLGYTYTIGPDESIAFGVRRIIGTSPYLVTNAPASCVTVENQSLLQPACTGAWNLSMAYHKRTPHDEYYFAYGDASQLSTVPQWIVKWIHYFGAEKGT